MLNQKIQNPNPDELMIEVDLCYELDPGNVANLLI